MKRDDDNSASDDALDRAIRDALRVEVDQHEVAHLEQCWRTEVRRDRWRRNALQLCTAAAAMIAVVAALVLIRSREQNLEFVQAAQELPSQVAVTDPAPPQVSSNSEDTQPSPSAGRPATAYEQLMFAARTGSKAEASRKLRDD